MRLDPRRCDLLRERIASPSLHYRLWLVFSMHKDCCHFRMWAISVKTANYMLVSGIGSRIAIRKKVDLQVYESLEK